VTGPDVDVSERFGSGGWEFTPEVVEVFDEHVRASVPHYDVIQHLVATASDWLLPAGGVYADLGSSTGTTAGLILDRHPDRRISAYLYDEQPDMVAKARQRLEQYGSRVRPLTTRIEHGPLSHVDADLTTALFTLQFLDVRDRLAALRLARAAANATGAILVAEKVLPVDARWAEIANDCSHDWKAEHGLSDTAIRAKASSLRGVLRPLPVAGLMRLLEASGWVDVDVVWRWHSWVLIGGFATHDGVGGLAR
jgi:tRNA (cmo5U34)-methyltransferase